MIGKILYFQGKTCIFPPHTVHLYHMEQTKQIEEKVFSYIREHHMLEPGDRVVAGISGGADSVCLLFVLLEWAKLVPTEIAVVHVNHGIRPEAGEDAAYVKELCDTYGLPFYLTRVNVAELAKKEKCSEEEMGRKVRYQAFEQAAYSSAKIAVAHNANDRSETMLFNLFRGTGMKGLGSILPVRNHIVRPILCLERREIEEYLKSRGIAYCTDVTNATDDYTRNRIRHNILPYAEEHVAKGCVARMTRTAEMLAETEDYLEQQTQAALKECVRLQESAQEEDPGKTYEISVSGLLAQHPVMQKRILHTIVKTLSPAQKDISYQHIADLLDLFTGQGNRSVDLPFGICGKREYEKVLVGIARNVKVIKTTAKNLPLRDGAYPMTPDSEICLTVIPAGDFSKKTEELPQNEYTKWLDYDKIKRCLILRTRETGDYLSIADGKGGMIHKSLKDYMINQKIPKEQRDRIPVLADGSHVVWLVGYRISEYYKITERTKNILQVQVVKKMHGTSNDVPES